MKTSIHKLLFASSSRRKEKICKKESAMLSKNKFIMLHI